MPLDKTRPKIYITLMLNTANNLVSESLVEKIKKLLRLASSTNEHEASLALEKCRALATEYDIDISGIDAWTDKIKENEVIEKNHIDLDQRRKSISSRFVCWLIQKHFGCRIIYHGSRNSKWRIYFIGKKRDIETGIYVYGYLNTLFMELWHKYRKDKNARTQVRGSYIYGLYSGLDGKLTEAQKQAEKQKFEEIKTEKGETEGARIKGNYSLMVVTNREKLDKALKDYFPDVKSGASWQSNLRDGNVLQDGISMGRTININKGITYNGQEQIA